MGALVVVAADRDTAAKILSQVRIEGTQLSSRVEANSNSGAMARGGNKVKNGVKKKYYHRNYRVHLLGDVTTLVSIILLIATWTAALSLCYMYSLLLVLFPQLKRIARALYSNPPTCGARIVAEVINDPALFAEWKVGSGGR